MSTELMKDIAHLRRNMPRNEIAMRVCDALEEHLKSKPPTIKTSSGSTIEFSGKGEPIRSMENITTTFDKTAYMRDYMRKKRATKGKS